MILGHALDVKFPSELNQATLQIMLLSGHSLLCLLPRIEGRLLCKLFDMFEQTSMFLVSNANCLTIVVLCERLCFTDDDSSLLKLQSIFITAAFLCGGLYSSIQYSNFLSTCSSRSWAQRYPRSHSNSACKSPYHSR